jgi:hypothetical protein
MMSPSELAMVAVLLLVMGLFFGGMAAYVLGLLGFVGGRLSALGGAVRQAARLARWAGFAPRGDAWHRVVDGQLLQLRIEPTGRIRLSAPVAWSGGVVLGDAAAAPGDRFDDVFKVRRAPQAGQAATPLRVGFHGLHVGLRQALLAAARHGSVQLTADRIVVHVDRLGKGPVEQSLQALLQAIHELQQPVSLSTIVRTDPEPRVRAEALRALSRQDLEAARRVARDLPERLGEDMDWFVERARVLGDEDVVRVIVRGSRDAVRIAHALGGLERAAWIRLLPDAASSSMEAMDACTHWLSQEPCDASRRVMRAELAPWLEVDPTHERFAAVFPRVWGLVSPVLEVADRPLLEWMLDAITGPTWAKIVVRYGQLLGTDAVPKLRALLDAGPGHEAQRVLRRTIQEVQAPARGLQGAVSIAPSGGGALSVVEPLAGETVAHEEAERASLGARVTRKTTGA